MKVSNATIIDTDPNSFVNHNRIVVQPFVRTFQFPLTQSIFSQTERIKNLATLLYPDKEWHSDVRIRNISNIDFEYPSIAVHTGVCTVNDLLYRTTIHKFICRGLWINNAKIGCTWHIIKPSE